MNEQLDVALCNKYPKIFAERHKSMQETAMCWGFEHGDGWYDIIDKLCLNIQGHIDWSRNARVSALRFNRAMARAITGDIKGLEHYYSSRSESYRNKNIEDALIKKEFRPVPDACPQVVAVQVKEKFGTLRFYIDGGDETIFGLIRMAESLSAVTCERCGNKAKTRGGSWLLTLCDEHAKALDK